MREPDYSILAKLRPPTNKNNGKKSYVGQKFNRLTVFSLVGYIRTKQAVSYWLCRCDCGSFRIVALPKLKKGSTKSCGCYINDIRGDVHRTHGMSRSSAHRRWADMLSRVNNPNTTCAHNYIGRGITACNGLKKFENFIRYSVSRPQSTVSTVSTTMAIILVVDAMNVYQRTGP